MPLIASGFLYKVTVTGVIGGITTKNVFWYFNTGPVKEADDVLAAFESKVDTNWSNLVSVNWDGETIEVDEVTSDDNFTEGAVTIDGIVAGDSLPNFDAFSIILSRSTKETRDGRKRLAGVAESQQSSGNLTAGAITLLDTLKTSFTDSLVVDGGSIVPVIVRKTYVDPEAVPRVLNPPADWIYNPIGGGVAQTKVTTQNSRKT